MSRPLRVLIVEDSADDADLVVAELRRSGFDPAWRRVWNAAQMEEAIAGGGFDLVLSDYSMPQFSGIAALRILRDRGIDVPFILVSGSVGEDVAVEAMRAGAHDYFRKDNLTRLSAAIDRELREAELRRKQRETAAALVRAEAAHRLMIESIRDYAVFTIGLDGRVASWNPGVERVKGYAEHEFVGMHFSSLFPAELRECGLPEEELRIAREQGRYEGEGWRRRKDGSLFWAEVGLTPLLDESGQHVGYTKVTRDISERKRLIDELHVAIRARDEFLSLASHELRTPVTALRLQVESSLSMLRDMQGEPAARLQHKLGAALRQTDRLTTLIATMLDVSSMAASQLELHREPVDLAALGSEVLAELERARSMSGSPIRLHADGPVVGEFDKPRLRLLLVNLLGNAIKFGLGQPIDLSIEKRDGRAVVEVRDRGTGIDPRVHEQIFQRFGRAVPETSYGGFGVGLWIAREVARAHGGTIDLQSEPGAGSTFAVVLPTGRQP